MNTTYRSVFSGQDIDEAIAAMKNSANGITIVSDFNVGGIEKAASAELTKILKQEVDQIKTPEYLQTLLDTIPNFNSMTDADRIKIDGLSLSFRGAFLNAAVRDSVIGTSSINFTGNDIILLFDNGDGVLEIQSWNMAGKIWAKTKLLGEFDPVSVSVASTIPVTKMNTTKFNTMKGIISVGNATQRQVQEYTITMIGSDVYLSVYGEVGNATLFSLTTSVAGNYVYLNLTTLAANLTVTGKQNSMI